MAKIKTSPKLKSKFQLGLKDKWDQHKFNLKLVNPANKRKYKVIVVGSGLCFSCRFSGKLGYQVCHSFCFQIARVEPIAR